MSNSSLVNYTKLSPNKDTPRTMKIDTITIHCAVGQLSVETLGDIFVRPERQASSNYGIGSDGRIGMYVEEKDRSWCSSTGKNDHRAITIECACDKTVPYAINDKVYASLVKLCVDICKRNNIPEMRWKGDKSLIGQVDKQNMTVHRWFAATACPGDYIYNHLGKIAADVNAILKTPVKPATTTPPTPVPNTTIYSVQVNSYGNPINANNMVKTAESKGFKTYIVSGKDGMHRVRAGEFSKKSDAEALIVKMKASGFNPAIVELKTSDITTATDTVKTVESKKSVDEVAREVIKGLWSNGQDRINRLTAAGFNYSAVQTKVEELLKK